MQWHAIRKPAALHQQPHPHRSPHKHTCVILRLPITLPAKVRFLQVAAARGTAQRQQDVGQMPLGYAPSPRSLPYQRSKALPTKRTRRSKPLTANPTKYSTHLTSSAMAAAVQPHSLHHHTEVVDSGLCWRQAHHDQLATGCQQGQQRVHVVLGRHGVNDGVQGACTQHGRSNRQSDRSVHTCSCSQADSDPSAGTQLITAAAG